MQSNVTETARVVWSKQRVHKEEALNAAPSRSYQIGVAITLHQLEHSPDRIVTTPARLLRCL